MTAYPVNIYLFKFNNRNTRKWCGICSKLIIKTPEHVIDVVLVFLLLTLNIFHTSHLFSSVSIVEVEQLNVSRLIFLFFFNFSNFSGQFFLHIATSQLSCSADLLTGTNFLKMNHGVGKCYSV